MEEVKEISVIIPAFNEEGIIQRTILETAESLKSFGINDFEIIMVNDGSSDNTLAATKEIQELQRDFVKIIDYKPNRGKGYALRRGAMQSIKEIVVFLDADMELHPLQIRNLLNKMQESGSEVVIGSKRSRESKVSYSLKRKIFSSVYYYFVKILFGLPLRDTQTGLKLFRAHALKSILGRLVIDKYAFDLELLIALNRKGFRIDECPVEVTQVRQKGRIGMRDIFRMLKDTFRIFGRLYFKKAYR
ncbi:MAG TPA: glycosyltransferase [Actinobacteria bacterium]|jgi:glycosyltransferase involved in cell wall biosynthesis|nr:glycosyltransferase [Actinomycetota bacterium]